MYLIISIQEARFPRPHALSITREYVLSGIIFGGTYRVEDMNADTAGNSHIPMSLLAWFIGFSLS